MKEERRLGRGIGEARLAFAERDPEVPRTLVPPPTSDPGFEHLAVWFTACDPEPHRCSSGLMMRLRSPRPPPGTGRA
ncbi:hypothetical protein [Streptomyces sp. NPDC001034]|uniref:hypothetical protein n=1 Tax=Streptomyces sp. NPDC001034 TaxID=3154375 RepID=UPI0033279247